MKKYYQDYPKTPSFKSTGIEQPITKFASPLISNLSDDWIVFGTGVMITPGFALTAKHVIADVVERYDDFDIRTPSPEPRDLQGRHNTFITQIIEGKIGYIWSVRQYFPSTFTDVCFLRLEPMFSALDLLATPKIALDLNPPEIGERIVAFGYPRTTLDVKGDEIHINIDPKTAVGEVVEVFQQWRDSMLPFPAFRTNARFDPGMSGGPVFNNSGKLCGLICSNMPPETADQDHVSYVSLLWPSMGTKVWLKLMHHDLTERFPVKFLAENSYITADGWESILLPSNNQVAWKVDAE